LINCVLENIDGETHPSGKTSSAEEEEAILAVIGKVTLYNC